MAEAHQGQVISSEHKDKYYRDHLKSLVIDFISSTTKEKSWMKHVKDIAMVADVAYFAFTSLSGNQTMGEEYNNILLVNKDKRSLPSKFKSALMVVFHVMLPHTIDKSTNYLTNITNRNQDISADQKRKILLSIKILSGFIKCIEKINYILFYLNGAYYHLSKRLTSLLYLQTRPLRFDSVYNKTYSLLGWLMLLQSLLASTVCVCKAWRGCNNNVNIFLYNLLGINLIFPPSSPPSSSSSSSSSSSLSSLASYVLQNVGKATLKQQQTESLETFLKEDSIPHKERGDTPSHKRQQGADDDDDDDDDDDEGNESSGKQTLTRRNTKEDATMTAPTNTSTPDNLNNLSNLPSTASSIYYKNNLTGKNTLSIKRRSCLLCCDQLKSPASTLCGHVFCYQCISEWCATKDECPVCKRQVTPSRLVFLRNFV